MSFYFPSNSWPEELQRVTAELEDATFKLAAKEEKGDAADSPNSRASFQISPAYWEPCAVSDDFLSSCPRAQWQHDSKHAQETVELQALKEVLLQ